MTRQIQIRRGTAAEHETFTGAVGEVTMDTTRQTLCVHDGETPGGVRMARADELMVPSGNKQDIVLGASGATYTAPGNGYFTWAKATKATNQYFEMKNTTAGGMVVRTYSPPSGGVCAGFLPARRGDECTATFTASGDLTTFCFIFAGE